MKKGKSGIGWDDSKLNDEKYCREWKIAGGNAEMLATYGTRHGESYHSDSVGSAVLFVDSDILKNCDLLDVPGFTGGVVSDNIAARDAKFKADILVYLSQASGFMGSEDFSYLKDSLKTIGVIENKNNPEVKPLSNIFVVATQAHIIDHGNNKKIKEILDDGCERFSDTLTEKFWKNRSSVSGMRYSKSDLRARFFSYTTDIASIRKDFEDNLKTIIEQMPELIKNQAIKLVKDICGRADETLEHEVEKYQNIISEREKYVQLLDEIEKNEPSRIARTTDEKTDIMREISKCSNRARKKFTEKYNEILSESHVVNLIDHKGYKSKKEDMQRLSSYINSELEDALNEILTIESKKFSDRVERFISEYDKRCKVSGVEIQGIDMTDFNAKRAFVAGLSGVAVYGGLAFWASTLGNLGAYILVAKGVSLLSAIGISVGGTAAAVSTVAAIGGPVVLGIAIAVVAALGVFGIFSGGWKKRVAKKLKNAYEEQDALLKYNNCIDEFWEDTEVAFIAATEKMEEEWQTYVNDLREKLNNYNIEELKQCVSQAEKTKDFFGNIPL